MRTWAGGGGDGGRGGAGTLGSVIVGLVLVPCVVVGAVVAVLPSSSSGRRTTKSPAATTTAAATIRSLFIQEMDSRSPARNSAEPPCEGCLTYRPPRTEWASRPTAIARRPATICSRKRIAARTSAFVGGRFDLGSRRRY